MYGRKIKNVLTITNTFENNELVGTSIYFLKKEVMIAMEYKS
jgi:hypothetical protein